ncbi:hypothetical protein BDN70DRAFT_570442 [Pholiota conissans]|uniref:Uncharacterized protein n=1 Tax=Pholiota conissans TaxID=109636 RepID=A0A9P5YPA8_9AGAR|nr:hypothetical protein BDN70DRAFT_570442 [Pholiota conissans]
MTFESLCAIESAPRSSGSSLSSILIPTVPPSFSLPIYPAQDSGLTFGFPLKTSNGAARRIHNSLQPILRLNFDILEHLFLTGAYLAANTERTTALSKSVSVTRTVLTYAHLTSALRQVALGSARLWALLVDFESASSEWNAELLRRSAGMGLQIVWQWSKATVDDVGYTAHARSRSGSGRGRIEWEAGDRTTARERRRREDRAKKARLHNVLQKEVLQRATTLGFAVPAPYFRDILLENLAAPGATLPVLESLRIVKSRPKRPSVTPPFDGFMVDEDDPFDVMEACVPLGVIANAPRLRRLAIAECNLPFSELLSSSSSIPLPHLISEYPPAVSPPSSIISTLHTLRHLQALQVADLPLRTAPTVHEWLRYLTLMPSLEELILEGAVLRKVDVTLRENLKTSLEDGHETRESAEEDGDVRRDFRDERSSSEEADVDSRSMEQDFVDKNALPKLRVLTLDAALEDVAVFATNLPLPVRTPRGRSMKWTLLCADVDSRDFASVEKMADLFSKVVDEDYPHAGVTPPPATSIPGLSLSLRATEGDVHLLLSTTCNASSTESEYNGPDFSLYVNLHSIGVADRGTSQSNLIGVDDGGRVVTAPSSISLVHPMLTALAHNVLPYVADLELDLTLGASLLSSLSNALARARGVKALTLGPHAAKGVLRMLHSEQKRLASYGSDSSYPDTPVVSESFPEIPDAVLLPSLHTLRVSEQSAKGPAWTALSRFLKVRKGNVTPIRRVFFNDIDVGKESRTTVERMDPRILQGRVRELEQIGVEVFASS